MTVFSAALMSRFQSLKTPFYYYDLDLLQETLKACKNEADRYDFHVHYAMKANFNLKILQAICAAGFGADCVSGNEVKKAVETGFKPEDIVFAGVGKSDDEIRDALNLNIFCFNVESVQELHVIDEIAASLGKKAQIALRINPNVDAKTHHHITTGLEENKFGISQRELPECIDALKKFAHLELVGIHFHVGSQVLDMDVFEELCDRVNEMNTWFEQQGFALKILNVGGGLGVDYRQPDQNPDFVTYFGIFHKHLKIKPGQQVYFELGRSLVAQCGTLVSRVLYIKNGLKKNFAILDAGMTELMRPALYQAYHKIDNLTSKGANISYDVVGPICESTDVFDRDVTLPETKRGDLIAIHTAGAYGEVMASNYNLRDQVPSVYSD